jgi:xylan 1,4-beta-xylosidase
MWPASTSRRCSWRRRPHRRDERYIFIAAEGVAGPEHSVGAFRSRDLAGPYAPFDGNPIRTQRDPPRNRESPIACTGHAHLVESPNGDWWAVFRGPRPDQAGHTLLGRETFLFPV